MTNHWPTAVTDRADRQKEEKKKTVGQLLMLNQLCWPGTDMAQESNWTNFKGLVWQIWPHLWDFNGRDWIFCLHNNSYLIFWRIQRFLFIYENIHWWRVVFPSQHYISKKSLVFPIHLPGSRVQVYGNRSHAGERGVQVCASTVYWQTWGCEGGRKALQGKNLTTSAEF